MIIEFKENKYNEKPIYVLPGKPGFSSYYGETVP
jgi:hypothetical protein